MISDVDPRIVANYIIGSADRPVRQIALQKLVYFAHGLYLTRYKKPLVKGFFEAWHYGPVHPAIYSAFKSYGREPITTTAKAKDIRTGQQTNLPELQDREAKRVIDATVFNYDGYTDSQLVNLSHAPEGPWDVVKQNAQNESMIGLRISNDLILERFGRHKLSYCTLSQAGDLDEQDDAPIAYNGLG